ncbi:hypothetical protein, partial [Massilia genomosp. 1]|uniref:hypothetical protein n=1 Tax=Massilia genomosp. 1 TaxID=2609280 RepID=UPI001C9E4446
RFIDCPVQLGRDAIARDIPIQVEKVRHRKSGAAAVVCATFRLIAIDYNSPEQGRHSRHGPYWRTSF